MRNLPSSAEVCARFIARPKIPADLRHLVCARAVPNEITAAGGSPKRAARNVVQDGDQRLRLTNSSWKEGKKLRACVFYEFDSLKAQLFLVLSELNGEYTSLISSESIRSVLLSYFLP